MKDKQKLRYGVIIKKYRCLAKLSQAELGSMLKVSRNTIINWESGSFEPDMDTVRLLCQKLDMPVGELYDLSDNVGLAQDEIMLLSAYRDLSPTGKVYAREVLQSLSNAEEKARSEHIRSNFFAVSEYHTAPAAGAGTLFNSLPPTLRFVRYTAANMNADAMARVSGQSMEPFYHSGDYVYFRYTHDAAPGDIVICSTADGAVIKAVDKNRRLYSLNSELPYGDKSEDDNVVVQGKVLGIVQPEDLPTEEEQQLINDLFADEISAFERAHGE